MEDMKTAPSVLASGALTAVERVAKALAMNGFGGYPVTAAERAAWPQWDKCLVAARAAIEAMRHFGDIPAEVASLAVETAKHDKTGEVLVWHVWTAMIDAALSQAKANA